MKDIKRIIYRNITEEKFTPLTDEDARDGFSLPFNKVYDLNDPELYQHIRERVEKEILNKKSSD